MLQELGLQLFGKAVSVQDRSVYIREQLEVSTINMFRVVIGQFMTRVLKVVNSAG